MLARIAFFGAFALALTIGCAAGGLDAPDPSGDDDLSSAGDDDDSKPPPAKPTKPAPSANPVMTTASEVPDTGAPVMIPMEAGMPEAAVMTVDAAPEATTVAAPVTIVVPFNFDHDCVTVNCPAAAPFPTRLVDETSGGSTDYCVVNSPAATGATVYMKEGQHCDNSIHQGMLTCSSVAPPAPLSALNLSITRANNNDPYTNFVFPATKEQCPGGTQP